MWRRSNLPGNPDSDQSISEEEDDQSYISLVENENAKEEEGGLLLQTKLEKLIGYGTETGNVSLEATLRKIPILSSLEEDDLEVPDSQEESYFASVQESESDHEIPQDEPVTTTWSTISKETKSLIHLNGIASVSSSHASGFRTKRVVKDQVRPKFSFHSYTHGQTSSKISDMAENLELADADMAIEEDPIAECLQDSEDAIPKLLDIPTDKIRVAKQNFKPYRGSEGNFAQKGSSLSILRDSVTDDDELPGPMDSTESSSSETDNDESSSLVANISDHKIQFVGDRFDEAIKKASSSSPKLSGGSSLHGKLQQIMKQEKETEIEMAKRLQSGIEKTDASSYIDVRIVSRQLEAKLIVCKCSIIDISADSVLFQNTQALAERKPKETTIIFSTKVCSDVDIETGRFIRVYAPWKEMEVKKTNEVIILCQYFSSNVNENLKCDS